MVRLLAGGFALILAVGAVAAEDKKESKDVVSWERKINDLTLTLDFGKDMLTIHAVNGCNGVTAKCKMTKEKDGTVKATITGVETKGQFPVVPKKGLEMTFKWKETGKTATLSDFTGEGLDEAKGAVEGEYEKK
jgi:hypothetical protein